MKEYAVSLELVYYHTAYVEADSEQEAIAKVMDSNELESCKARIHDTEYEFDNIELIIAKKTND